MRLTLSDDQLQILNFLDGLSKPFSSVPIHDTAFALTSEDFDRQLSESGFLDVRVEPELGPVTAALIVERLARLPFTVEAAASALVRPLIDLSLPRPLCLVEADQLHKPVRFLRPGATVIVLDADAVYSFSAGQERIRDAGEEVLYAYPVSFLTGLPEKMTRHEVEVGLVRANWRTGIAAEGAGLLAAALESVVTHVSERKQFGRPLAMFQALRHRLAEAKVWAEGTYWLAMKAAASNESADASLAALYLQDAAKRFSYDFHQFLGAMGMTLEHPLHLWTYRLKALTSDLGGSGQQALAASVALWPR